MRRDSKRFPEYVYGRGREPDARFSLANERTFLAWIRTSMTLLAAAVALSALDLPIKGPLQLVGAALFALASVGSAAWAWTSWVAIERALRLGSSLPGNGAGAALSAVVVLAVLALTLGVALSMFDR